jgi:hypothetical protein
MRRLGWGLAVLWLAATVSVAPAQGPRYRSNQDGGLLTELFSPAKPKADAKAKPDSKAGGKAAEGSPAAPKPAPRQDLARDLERLQKAWDRRDAVLLRLEEIALQTHDEGLSAEAGRLRELAWKLYQDQSARLQAASTRRPDSEPPAKGTSQGRGRFGRGPVANRSRAGDDRPASAGEGER